MFLVVFIVPLTDEDLAIKNIKTLHSVEVCFVFLPSFVVYNNMINLKCSFFDDMFLLLYAKYSLATKCL